MRMSKKKAIFADLISNKESEQGSPNKSRSPQRCLIDPPLNELNELLNK